MFRLYPTGLAGLSSPELTEESQRAVQPGVGLAGQVLAGPGGEAGLARVPAPAAVWARKERGGSFQLTHLSPTPCSCSPFPLCPPPLPPFSWFGFKP